AGRLPPAGREEEDGRHDLVYAPPHGGTRTFLSEVTFKGGKMRYVWIALALVIGCGDKKDGGKPAAKTYAKGEDAPAGEVVHKIALAESMDVIPAAKAIDQFKESAEDQPAPDGCK